MEKQKQKQKNREKQFNIQNLRFVKDILCFNKFTKIKIFQDTKTKQKIIQKSIQIDGEQNIKYAMLQQHFMDSLKSQYIVQLLYSQQKVLPNHNQALVLYMQFYQNGDLQQYLLKTKPKLLQRIQIFFQILIGLKDLHKRFIIHRDLKLSNIFVTKNGKIKIGDLGVITQSSRGVAISYVGTFGYQAPQIFAKQGNYGENVDIWSLGFLSFQLLNQQYNQGGFRDPFLPLNTLRKILTSFGGKEQVEQYKKILKKPLIFDYNLPNYLKQLIRKMLDPSPQKRISFKQIYDNKFFQNADGEGSKSQYLKQINKFRQIYEQISEQKKQLIQKSTQYKKLNDQYFIEISKMTSQNKKIPDINLYKFYFLVIKKMKLIYETFQKAVVLQFLKQFFQIDNNVKTQYKVIKRKLDMYFVENKEAECQKNQNLNSQQSYANLKNHFVLNFK